MPVRDTSPRMRSLQITFGVSVYTRDNASMTLESFAVDPALDGRLVHRALGGRDLPVGEVRVMPLEGRTRPVPAARVAERPREACAERARHGPEGRGRTRWPVRSGC